MSAKSKWIKIVLPLVILLGGFLATRALIANRPAPKKAAVAHPGALVEVIETAREDRQVRIEATGTVQARQEVDITPQVSGRVTGLSPSLVAGGFFKEGDLMFEIDAVDYRLAVERARAALAKAEYDLATVESQARVARDEWERLAPAEGADPNPLALYEPQLKNARAGIASARATLEQALLDLERTRIRAPFNCRVRSEQVDLGQYVRAGSGVAVVAGTDLAEVIVPLPVEELRWLRVPGPGTNGEGSAATVEMAIGEERHRWEGRIVRSLGEVDPRGRMSRVVVAVEDPYGLSAPDDEGPSLEVGMFVKVSLTGKSLPGVVAIPRRALREDSTAWLVDAENRLVIRTVEVARLERAEALIAEGIEEGARVVVSPLPGAAEGMKLRPTSGESVQ